MDVVLRGKQRKRLILVVPRTGLEGGSAPPGEGAVARLAAMEEHSRGPAVLPGPQSLIIVDGKEVEGSKASTRPHPYEGDPTATTQPAPWTCYRVRANS